MPLLQNSLLYWWKSDYLSLDLFLLKCLYYVSSNPGDFLCLVTVYGYDYIYLYFMVSTRSRNSGKAQVSPLRLFLVSCRSAKGTTRGQCRATLTGTEPGAGLKKTGSTTIQIHKQTLLDWMRPVPKSSQVPFKNKRPSYRFLSWEMITFLLLNLYSTFLKQGYFIHKHYQHKMPY